MSTGNVPTDQLDQDHDSSPVVPGSAESKTNVVDPDSTVAIGGTALRGAKEGREWTLPQYGGLTEL